MTNAFERHSVDHLSPSAINSWINSPSLFVLERLLKFRGQMGASAHRGTATEAGVSIGLFDHGATLEACVTAALPVFDKLTALSGDPKREAERAVIPGMIKQGLTLREHGLPFTPNEEGRFGAAAPQHKVEIRLEGVDVPVIGYLDWLYAEEVLDLKTTQRIPSSMSPTHRRQATVYKVGNMDRRVRFCYVSEKKIEKHTLTREEFDISLVELTGASQRLERFLSLSDDPLELAALVPHGTDNFYWSDAATAAKGREVFGY